MMRHGTLWAVTAYVACNVAFGALHLVAAAPLIGAVVFVFVRCYFPWRDPPLGLYLRLLNRWRVRPKRTREMYDATIKHSPYFAVLSFPADDHFLEWLRSEVKLPEDDIVGSTIEYENPALPPLTIRAFHRNDRGLIMFASLGQWPPRGKRKRVRRLKPQERPAHAS